MGIQYLYICSKPNSHNYSGMIRIAGRKYEKFCDMLLDPFGTGSELWGNRAGSAQWRQRSGSFASDSKHSAVRRRLREYRSLEFGRNSHFLYAKSIYTDEHITDPITTGAGNRLRWMDPYNLKKMTS
jgi:hypothetical protein